MKDGYNKFNEKDQTGKAHTYMYVFHEKAKKKNLERER